MIDIQKLRESYEVILPPLIARASIAHWTGNLYSANTMSAFDSRGIGVKNPTKIDNKKIAYNKEDLINWLVERAEAANAKEAANGKQ